MNREIVIDWIAGYCPVQAEGKIAGKVFYFRARGNRWSLSIGGDVVLAPEWLWSEAYGDAPFAAGWMEADEARAFIEAAAARFLNGEPANG